MAEAKWKIPPRIPVRLQQAQQIVVLHLRLHPCRHFVRHDCLERQFREKKKLVHEKNLNFRFYYHRV